MANHRADGRATVRKHRAVGGTHRDAALPASAVKVGVLGVLATATIAAPLAAAAAGVDEAAPAEPVAQAAQQPAAQEAAAAATAPVELPDASAAVAEERSAEGEAADRSEERTSPADDAKDEKEPEKTSEDAEATGIEVSVPEPEPVVAEGEVAADGQAAAESAEGEAAPANDSGYIRPASGPITSGYGGRVHPVLGYFKGHNGVDFGAACGTPAKAAKGGKVIAVEYNSASGNRVKIDHGNGVVTGYYHLQGFNTSVGATVAQGDTIGYVGSTGRSTGCHLHFAKMDEAGNYSDPMSLLR